MRAMSEGAQGDQPSSLKVAQGDHHEHLKALKQTDPQHDCVMCIIENRRFNRPELLLAVYVRECIRFYLNQYKTSILLSEATPIPLSPSLSPSLSLPPSLPPT